MKPGKKEKERERERRVGEEKGGRFWSRTHVLAYASKFENIFDDTRLYFRLHETNCKHVLIFRFPRCLAPLSLYFVRLFATAVWKTGATNKPQIRLEFVSEATKIDIDGVDKTSLNFQADPIFQALNFHIHGRERSLRQAACYMRYNVEYVCMCVHPASSMHLSSDI